MINNIDLNSDRLGCYRINDQKYFSRLQTAKIHQETGQFPHWWFHDEVYSSMDWTVEPSESLSQLYKQRAQQLRDTYDYLILCFSGGADSYNILNTFSINNIFVDEIMIYHNLSKEQDYQFDQLNNMNAEVVKTARPFAQEFMKNNPKTLYREIDFSDLQYQFFLSDKNTEQFIWSINSLLAPNTGILAHKLTLSPDYPRLIDQGKKICFITGTDKPKIRRIDNRYVLNFLNLIDNVSFVGTTAPYEFFYWTPDLPEIVVKQAHIAKQLVESDIVSLDNLLSRNSPFIKHLYANWPEDTWQRSKGRLTYSCRDRWFFALPDNDPAKLNWTRAVNTYWNELPDFWKNDSNDIDLTTKFVYGKNYFLN